jgi:hypothetical protein
MHNLHENKNDQIRYRKMNMQQRVLQYQHQIYQNNKWSLFRFHLIEEARSNNF